MLRLFAHLLPVVAARKYSAVMWLGESYAWVCLCWGTVEILWSHMACAIMALWIYPHDLCNYRKIC